MSTTDYGFGFDGSDIVNLILGGWSLYEAGKSPNIPDTKTLIKDAAAAYTDDPTLESIRQASLNQLGIGNDVRRQSIQNELGLYGISGDNRPLAEQVAEANARAQGMGMQGNLSNVMGGSYDATKSAAENLGALDRMANPELYAQAQRIAGAQYGGLGQVGGLYGDAATAGSGLVNNMVGRANEMVNRDGALSARDVRDVNEMSRAGFNDRGRVRDSSAVVGEIANNEALRRARRNEAWSYAGQAGGMEQGYNLANQGAVNAMTSQNLNVANDRDMFNANLRNQDFGNQMQLMQMGMNAYSGLRQNPYGALVQGGAPINMGSIGGQSAVGVQDAMNMNNALTGMNVQNQQNKQNLWGNMAGGFLSNIGNG